MESLLAKQLLDVYAASGSQLKVKMVNGDVISLKPSIIVIGKNAVVTDSGAGLQESVTEQSGLLFEQE